MIWPKALQTMWFVNSKDTLLIYVLKIKTKHFRNQNSFRLKFDAISTGFWRMFKIPTRWALPISSKYINKRRKNWREGEGEWWSSFGRSPTTKKEASGIVRPGVTSLYRYNSRGFRLYNTCFYKGSTMGKSFIRFQILIRIARSSFLPEPWSAVVQNCSLVCIK